MNRLNVRDALDYELPIGLDARQLSLELRPKLRKTHTHCGWRWIFASGIAGLGRRGLTHTHGYRHLYLASRRLESRDIQDHIEALRFELDEPTHRAYVFFYDPAHSREIRFPDPLPLFVRQRGRCQGRAYR